MEAAAKVREVKPVAEDFWNGAGNLQVEGAKRAQYH